LRGDNDEAKKSLNDIDIRLTDEVLTIMKTIPQVVTSMTGIEMNRIGAR
jgi:hypothetical protein